MYRMKVIEGWTYNNIIINICSILHNNYDEILILLIFLEALCTFNLHHIENVMQSIRIIILQDSYQDFSVLINI